MRVTLTKQEQAVWLTRAYAEATFSPDPSTQNGAIVLDWRLKVLGMDHNRFPYGVEYKPSRWERPAKYAYIEHAERNAIFKAVRYNYDLAGTAMVCPWAACADCARAIASVGITQVYTHAHHEDDRWRESVERGMEILDEADVQVVYYEGDLPDAPAIRIGGNLWHP